MKQARSSNNKQNKQGHSHKPKPEIRDDMDSRENKELNYKDGNNRSGKARKKRQ